MDDDCGKPGCKFCDKKDLPILPVRHAVARAGSAVPELDAPFGPEGFPTQLDGAAKYTVRSLRSGYLYVWDEKRQVLDGYFVTPDAYLYHCHRQDLRRPVSAPSLNIAPAFVCSRTAGGPAASTITVEKSPKWTSA